MFKKDLCLLVVHISKFCLAKTRSKIYFTAQPGVEPDVPGELICPCQWISAFTVPPLCQCVSFVQCFLLSIDVDESCDVIGSTRRESKCSMCDCYCELGMHTMPLPPLPNTIENNLLGAFLTFCYKILELCNQITVFKFKVVRYPNGFEGFVLQASAR